jgi:hypothetical protein
LEKPKINHQKKGGPIETTDKKREIRFILERNPIVDEKKFLLLTKGGYENEY